jgi:hypothetical protein
MIQLQASLGRATWGASQHARAGEEAVQFMNRHMCEVLDRRVVYQRGVS